MKTFKEWMTAQDMAAMNSDRSNDPEGASRGLPQVRNINWTKLGQQLNYDPTDWRQRSQLDNDDAIGKTPKDILNKEHYNAWKHIVTTNFPGGNWQQQPENLEDFLKGKRNQTGAVYIVSYMGREIELSILCDRGEMKATVDFDWEDSSQVQQSGKEGMTFGGSISGRELQKGSLQFMKDLQQKYLAPLKYYGVKIVYHPADQRRDQVYKKGLSMSGYKQMPSTPYTWSTYESKLL